MVLWSAPTVLLAFMHSHELLEAITGLVLVSLQQLIQDHGVKRSCTLRDCIVRPSASCAASAQ
jgi:hypothetical protein